MQKPKAKVVTRFPPSPTGYFHIGSARTALFNYLFAAHNGGKMEFRFEDTDRERSKKEFEKDIEEGLAWLGLHYEGAIWRQSERTDVYRTRLRSLVENGKAYEAEESTAKPGTKVIRFRNPNTRVTFSDLIRGELSFDTTELKDFIIARSLDEPLYHLAVVADDHDMGVTHVIRGEDHISNTQRQILILEALGFERPAYAHIPLILAPDRSKMSKRHGAVSINEYRAEGYLPGAIVNYLALLGWNPGGDQELFTLPELVEKFSLEAVQKGGAVFDIEKLRWFNREYLKKLPDAEFMQEIRKRFPEAGEKFIPLMKERITTWSDIDALKEEFSFFFEEPALDAAKIPGKGSDEEGAKRHLTEVRKLLETLPSSGEMTADVIKNVLWSYAEAEGRGAVLWPLRYALTGREKSPDPFTVAAFLGKEKTIERVEAAITALG